MTTAHYECVDAALRTAVTRMRDAGSAGVRRANGDFHVALAREGMRSSDASITLNGG
jgi:hypothetical protein